MNLDKPYAEAIYKQADLIYGLTDKILKSIEADSNDPALQLSLVDSVVKKLENAANEISDIFLDVYGSKKLATRANKEKIAVASRSLYDDVLRMQERVLQLPESSGNEVADSNKYVSRSDLDGDILPTQSELGKGKIVRGWEKAAKEHPEHKNIIHHTEQAVTQVFRIIYRFSEPDIGLVDKPNELVPGRKLADTLAEATGKGVDIVESLVVKPDTELVKR